MTASGFAPANATTANSLYSFCGLQEEYIDIKYHQNILAGGGAYSTENGLGINSTSGTSGKLGGNSQSGGTGQTSRDNMIAEYIMPPTLGINQVTALLFSNPGAMTFEGGETGMVMSAQWRG